MHATIPKGNMEYGQYTVPDTVPVKPTFISLKNSELETTHNTFRVVECTLFDNLSRNSCKKTWGSDIVDGGERETGRFDTSRCDALEITRILITSSIACA